MADIYYVPKSAKNIDPAEAVYDIRVVSRLVKIPVWTLREIDKAGIVRPKRLGKKTMLYCNNDLKKLDYIHYLIETKKVNLHGIKLILEMEEQKNNS